MQGSQFLAGQALSIGQNTLSFFVSAGIMLYVLFFLFRDGREIGRNIRACDAAERGPQPPAARHLRRGGARDRQGQHHHRRASRARSAA